MKKFTEQTKLNRSYYWSVISLVDWSAGGTVRAQSTNAVLTETSTNVTQLGTVTVVGQLDAARNQIIPDLGATAYTMTKEQIAAV